MAFPLLGQPSPEAELCIWAEVVSLENVEGATDYSCCKVQDRVPTCAVVQPEILHIRITWVLM